MENEYNQEFATRLESICTQYTNKTAITFMRNDGSKTLFTFGEIFNYIKTAKESFNDIGLYPGDRAAIIASNSPYAVITGLALAYSNITNVLIDATMPTSEINRLLEYSDVRTVFTVSDIYDELDGDCIDGSPVYDISTISDKLLPFNSSIIKVGKKSIIDLHTDVIAILYSSGTTASVKGVMVTYAAVNSARQLYNKLSGLTDIDSGLLALPFNHVAGFFCFYQLFMCGCELGFIEDMDVSKIATAFQVYNPSFFALVPKFYEIAEQKIHKIIQSKAVIVKWFLYALLGVSHFLRKRIGINVGKVLFKGIRDKVFGKNIKLIGVGASVCKETTVSFFLDLGIETFANFYSLTETYVPTVATGVFDRYPAGTEGNINRFDEINIKIHASDENGIGEIRIKTILIMKGYFRDPELTAAAFDEDGYFKTGDLGYVDKKGYLHITGRIKEAILMHTGKKVAPSDVDALYAPLCPDIAIASCGVPNKDNSYDEIHLFIEDVGLSADEQQKLKNLITEFSSETSTLFQISGIHFINKLPITSVGKVKRFKLKEIALLEYAGGKHNEV
jgi:long-chain acyl-CoA synthetase